jgi:hypothetical protein
VAQSHTDAACQQRLLAMFIDLDTHTETRLVNFMKALDARALCLTKLQQVRLSVCLSLSLAVCVCVCVCH